MGCIVEQSDWVLEAPNDGLQASTPQGRLRARNYGKKLKDSIGQAAAKAHVARTGQKVVRAMKRFRPDVAAPPEGSVSGLERARCGRYRLAIQRTFAPGRAGPFFSAAQDGTRVAGLDMLFTCLWSPRIQLGCWLPPMVWASDP